MDGWKFNLTMHTFTMRGSHEASLVKFCPVVNRRLHDGRWMDRQTDGLMDRKIMLLLHTYHTGKSCNKFGSNSTQWFRRRQCAKQKEALIISLSLKHGDK